MSAEYGTKVAIITGGASGIGRALGIALSKRGAEVVLADRQIDEAERVAEGIVAAGGRARAAELDVRDRKAFAELAIETRERSGRVDMLFNNAGIGVGGEMAHYDPEDFDDVLDVNVRGVAHGIQAVYPMMIDQGGGQIVNTASIAGFLPAAIEGSYTASKHAVYGLSRSLRIEGRRYGVKVNALCPGVIRTPILHGGAFGRLKFRVSKKIIDDQWERMRPMDPDVFADKVLDAVAKDEAIIVIPRWWKAFWYLDRLSPDLSQILWQKLYEDLQRTLQAEQDDEPARQRTQAKPVQPSSTG